MILTTLLIFHPETVYGGCCHTLGVPLKSFHVQKLELEPYTHTDIRTRKFSIKTLLLQIDSFSNYISFCWERHYDALCLSTSRIRIITFARDFIRSFGLYHFITRSFFWLLLYLKCVCSFQSVSCTNKRCIQPIVRSNENRHTHTHWHIELTQLSSEKLFCNKHIMHQMNKLRCEKWNTNWFSFWNWYFLGSLFFPHYIQFLSIVCSITNITVSFASPSFYPIQPNGIESEVKVYIKVYFYEKVLYWNDWISPHKANKRTYETMQKTIKPTFYSLQNNRWDFCMYTYIYISSIVDGHWYEHFETRGVVVECVGATRCTCDACYKVIHQKTETESYKSRPAPLFFSPRFSIMLHDIFWIFFRTNRCTHCNIIYHRIIHFALQLLLEMYVYFVFLNCITKCINCILFIS